MSHDIDKPQRDHYVEERRDCALTFALLDIAILPEKRIADLAHAAWLLDLPPDAGGYVV